MVKSAHQFNSCWDRTAEPLSRLSCTSKGFHIGNSKVAKSVDHDGNLQLHHWAIVAKAESCLPKHPWGEPAKQIKDRDNPDE